MGFKWGMTVFPSFEPQFEFQIKIKMPNRKLRSEMGLLDTLQVPPSGPLLRRQLHGGLLVRVGEVRQHDLHVVVSHHRPFMYT